MSSREQNSELKVIAQRDEAFRQLDEALELERKAKARATYESRRSAELSKEIATLRVLVHARHLQSRLLQSLL